MNPAYRSVLDDCLRLVKESNPGVPFASVVIGSVARGVDTDRSDIDVLLVSKDELARPRCEVRVHVQAFTLAVFLRRLREGDDFVAWCVRLGVPLFSSEIWDAIRSSEEARIWPNWKLKIQHAVRRLILASDLFRCGDYSASSEEVLYSVGHIGRAVLLKLRIFPLSRPEMVEQLNKCGEPVLSGMLGRLLAGNDDRRFLYQTMRYLKRRLIDLDRASYGAYATRHAQCRMKRIRARVMDE